MTGAEPSAARSGPVARWVDSASSVLQAVGPPLLFGLRLWASVCLALYIAFWLELDNAYWAGTTAAIVCQPHLGASLRKGWFRMIGTLVGAVAVVVLTACFPQDRGPFLVGLALWGAGCALVATLLRNFAAYSAALAGYTVAIIASDQLGATGGPNGQAFMLAVYRASEICIGIVCAGVVLASTDFGGARRRLATVFAAISAEIGGRFTNTLALAGPNLPDTQPVRRELVRRVIALDPVIDEAIGEFCPAPLPFSSAADSRRRLARRSGRLADRGLSPPPTFARRGAASGGRHSAGHAAGAAISSSARRAGTLDRRPRRPAPDL